MKKITTLILSLSLIMIFSCEKEDSEVISEPYPQDTNSIQGVWTRLPGPSGDRTDIAVGGIEGEPEDRVYMCEKQGSTAAGLYKGTLNGNTVVWDAQYGLPDANLERIGDGLELTYPACSFCIPTDYESGSWSGDCGALSNVSTDGSVMFWVNSDLGCGSITVNVAGISNAITGYYVSSPSCGVSGSANFTLSPGNYPYTASCSGYSWNGNVTVTAGGCYKMQLTL